MIANKNTTVFISAPLGRAAIIRLALEQAGFACQHYSAFAIEWLPCKPPQNLPSAIIVTSPNAVHGAINAGLKLPPQPRYFAIGRGTAEALAARGIKDCLVAQPAGSEGLLKLNELNARQYPNAWLLTGEGGRGLLEKELPARGIQLQRLACYRRLANNQPQQLAACFENGPPQISIASSIEALDNLAFISDADTSALLGQCHWLVTSQRIAERLRSHWPDAAFSLCKGPDAKAIVAACQAWQQEQ